jgi:hypothetical protein
MLQRESPWALSNPKVATHQGIKKPTQMSHRYQLAEMYIMASISYLCRAASSLARISFGNTLKAKLLDPAAVGLLDRNDVVVEAHLLACAREVANPMNDIAADRGYIIILPIPPPKVPHLINAEATVYSELVFGKAMELSAFHAKLVWQLTDHFGDDVLQSNNPHVAAELIDHHGQVRLPVTKMRQQFLQWQHLGDDDQLFFDCQQARLWLVQLHEHVFDVDQADRAVKILRTERKTGVARRLGTLKVLAEREAGVEVYNLSTRCHYLAHNAPAYLEGVGDNFMADRADSRGFGAFIQDQPQFLLAVGKLAFADGIEVKDTLA